MVEDRHDVIAIIDRFMENSQDGCNIWTDKELIVSLTKFVNLKNVPKLRVCHQVAKHDPSVIVGLRIAMTRIILWKRMRRLRSLGHSKPT